MKGRCCYLETLYERKMKILHICVTGPYTDGWNYQENLLTKYQIKAGHSVSIIASQWSWDATGNIKKIFQTDYINRDGVRIYRLAINRNRDVFYRYKRFLNFYETIEKITPDVIFVHNIQFFDIDQIVKYAKNVKVKIFVDNHADFSNSARSVLGKIFYKVVWRHYAKLIEPYTIKFYGVLPSRVDFLENIYSLPKEKCTLLLMGGDDELVYAAKTRDARHRVRSNYQISESDFLIVTGGKIDEFKTQILLLMQSVRTMDISNVKLLVFGTVANAYKEQVNELCNNDNIFYIGFISGEESYSYFAAADLVVFPGRHSVYWEQVVAQGIPMLCKYWKGTTHVDIGGNVRFLKEDSEEILRQEIQRLIDNPEEYKKMKEAANGKRRNNFLYKSIAVQSIENNEKICD